MIAKNSFYQLTPLAVAIAFLSACSSAPTTPTYVVKQPSVVKTLASLDTSAISIINDTTFNSAPQTSNNSTNRSSVDVVAEYIAANQSSPHSLDAVINKKLNEALYDRLIADAKKAPNPSTATAYFNLARRLKTSDIETDLDKAERELLNKNVAFYQDLLERMPATESKADIYYELAKNYDLLTQKDDSIATLKILAEKHPETPYLTEVNFRLAEHAFAKNRFSESAAYYAKVLENSKSGFYDQALYKRAWSLYRSADFEAALPLFFSYADKIWVKPQKSAQEAESLQNALDVISLSFIQMDGARSLNAYFDKIGSKFYESIIYNRLAKTYIDKKIYKEAAEVYAAFIARHPFDPDAPELSSAIINTYDLGGFPSLVVTAKEQFVENYNTESNYWKQASPDIQSRLRPTLEGHIVELAKHYHATAQETGQITDYEKAAKWYRAHLALNPKEEDAVAVNQLLAEVLYASKNYPEAITEFEKTAYGYSANPNAKDAAYFALLSYQEWDKFLAADLNARKIIMPKRVASTIKYAEKFAEDKNTPIVMQGLIQYLYDNYKDYDDAVKQLSQDIEKQVKRIVATFPQEKSSALMVQGLTNLYLHFKDYDSAVRTASALLAIDPPVDEKLRIEAATVIADAHFDKGNLEEADKAYQQVLAFNIKDPKQKSVYQDRLATTYYRQAEKLRNDKNPEQAAQAFLKAAEVASDAKLKATADFDAADVLYKAEKYPEAIPILIAFKTKHPESPLAQDMLEKLAFAYEKSGDLTNAAQQFQAIAVRDQKKNPAAAREAVWAAAETYEKAQQPEQALKIYQQVIADNSNPVDLRAEAYNRSYVYYSKNNLNDQVQNTLKGMAQFYDKLGDKAPPRVKYLGAMAHFKLAQPVYDSFAAIPLTQPLKASLAPKKKAMQLAISTYNKVASIGVAEFTTAANYQQALIYQKLAADLMNSEKPKSMSDLELEQYTILLEEQTEPFNQKAIDIYKANANLVTQEVYDTFVQKSFAALAELEPGRYNKSELVEDAINEIY
jgi:tetratricopeptide (TPR) repeat protein